jgi:hypothetical protein
MPRQRDFKNRILAEMGAEGAEIFGFRVVTKM